MKNINENCKKYFYILFTLLFFTSVFTLTGISKEEAAATETSTATYSSATPQISYSVTGNKTVGSTITIAVNVTNGANIYGGSLDLLFDSNMLEITSAKMGSLFEKDLEAPLINDTKTPGKTSIVVTLSGANKKLSVTNGSLVIINAKIKNTGTLNLKTTNDLSYLNLNSYTSCIKLSDSHGGKINYVYNDYKVTFLYSKSKIEDNSPYINYVGNWISASNPAFGGNSIKYSATPNNYILFKFKGTAFRWIGTKAKSRGIAKLDIDGKVVNIDSYSPSTITKQVLYENTSLSDSEHVVKIYVTNNKNSNASNILVDVDRFEINGTPTITYSSYEDNSSYIKYIGNWISASNPAFGGNSIKYSATPNNYILFKFKGTAFRWIGTKAKSRGIAKLDIDGKVFNIDSYSPSTITKQVLYENTSLSDSEHVVKIYVTNNKNSNASNILVDVDRFEINGTPTITYSSYEDNSPYINYVGNWISASNPAFGGNSIKYSATPNNYILFKFKGTAFRWIGTKAKSRGIAKLDIDGKVFNIDSYSPSTITKQVLYENTSLSDSEHVVKIYVTNNKNSNASNILVDVDRFDINGYAY